MFILFISSILSKSILCFSGGETTTDDEGPLQEVRRQEPLEDQAGRERRPRPPPSPRSHRRAPFDGTKLKLKKGRRARQRYDSERSLFAIAEIDPDEPLDTSDIQPENRFVTEIAR